jgi:prepilin-type N-terminal cleavage/methylation domain-containing protein/prepilin-type processing-associated H-X9-DG protein
MGARAPGKDTVMVTSRTNGSRKQQIGFTLIELMVVISIISMLAAIMFPAFSAARAKARSTVCLSNIKQLGMALLLYADDYDEGFAPFDYKIDDEHWQYWYGLQTGTWPDFKYDLTKGLLEEYKHNVAIMHCPGFDPTHPMYGRGLGYGYNIMIGGNSLMNRKPSRLAQLQRPSDTIVFADAALHYDPASWDWPPKIVFDTWESTMIVPPSILQSWGYPSMEYRFHDPRHFNRANVFFADGHAKSVHRTELDGSEDMWNITNYTN